MIPKATECIFCGAREVTAEHVFSRGWLRRLWGLPKGHQLGHQHVRSHSERGDEFNIRWSKQEADLIVYCVCSGCNSGWMNTLDRRAQKIIDPMTQGEPTRLGSLRDIAVVVR